jgi:hypothetical protein
MASKIVRAPDSRVLIGAGVALLLLTMRDAAMIAENANHYRPEVMEALAGGVITKAILGIALLFVAVRQGRFAWATAVIIATLLMFSFALNAFASLAFASVHYSWWNLIYLAIAMAILWPLTFPWSWSANKPVVFLMASIFGALTLLLGTLALLARL